MRGHTEENNHKEKQPATHDLNNEQTLKKRQHVRDHIEDNTHTTKKQTVDSRQEQTKPTIEITKNTNQMRSKTIPLLTPMGWGH